MEMIKAVLFKNDSEHEMAPAYSNNTFVLEQDFTLKAGQKYQIAIWKKDSTKDGRPMDGISLQIKENDFDVSDVTSKTRPDEDIPF